jgi:outer membrane scaffolding protein for murein synthesis (MipA/OmpV family)
MQPGQVPTRLIMVPAGGDGKPMQRATLRGRLVAALLAGAGIAALAVGPVAAQDKDYTVETRMTVGLGASVGPSYFGSDDYELGPWGTVRFDYLRLPGGLSWGSAQAIGVREGFGLRGAVRYIGSRDGRDELQGLDDVDPTLEIGLGIGYETRDWRAFTDVRYGFGGHEAWVAEVGADAIYQPIEGLIVNAGPRLEFGTQGFMETYFGITDEESIASGLPAYSPGGGLTAVGFELGARYAFTDAWGIEGAATYDRLMNDAADSPITELGSADQFGFRLGITRTISLGF